MLREETGCQTVASELGPEAADLRLADGARLKLGSLEVEVLATPGHTDDSVSYRIGSHVFTGDALFVRGTGRTDFQNGHAGQLYDSITQRIFSLPDNTRVWPGRDYRGHTVSSVGEEKRFNPRLAGKSRAEFIAIMDNLGLPPPKYIHQAVPANRELGLGQGPEETTAAVEEWDVHQAVAHAEQVHVLDVREPHEYDGELGHIPGADNVPMGKVADLADTWDREKPMLVVWRSGRRSREVAQLLAQHGFRRVLNLRGGMLAYRAHDHRTA